MRTISSCKRAASRICLFLAIAVALVVAGSSQASVLQIQPSDEFGTPQDEFFASDVLFADVFTDIKGGTFCVTRAQAEEPFNEYVCRGLNLWDDLQSAQGRLKAGGTLLKALGPSIVARAVTVEVVSAGLGFGLTFVDTPQLDTLQWALDLLKEISCRTKKMWSEIAADPADPNYKVIASPEFDALGDTGDAAENQVAQTLERQHGYGEALIHSVERYEGALDAGDVPWQHAQAQKISEYSDVLVGAMIDGAGALRDWAAEVDGPGSPYKEPIVTQADLDTIQSVYARVRASGFTPDELAQLQSLGLSDAEIARVRAIFDEPVENTTVDTSMSTLLRNLADELEADADGIDLFGRTASSIAGQINQAPTASFDASSSSGPSPLEVTFTDTSTDPDQDAIVSKTWDFGDSNSSEGATVTHTYTSPGTYAVSHTVADYLDSSAPRPRPSSSPAISRRSRSTTRSRRSREPPALSTS